MKYSLIRNMYYLGRILFSLIFLSILIPACRERNPEKELVSIALENESTTPLSQVRQIFYNIYLPTEMSRIFERTGTNYNPSIPNSPDNFSRYTSPDKIALNLGLYGVDMIYSKLYDQRPLTVKYFLTAQMLSEKLGIPDTCYQNIIDAFEMFPNDKDTLTFLAGEIYKRTDKYLKENSNTSYSTLIILGGWIEALYIACKILESDPDNMEIMNRIGEQKYSLNSLIYLLNNYQDNIYIVENILMLRQLKKCFDKFEIFYNQNSFKVDTVNDIISASDYVVEIPPEIISEISHLISEIRSGIVN